MAKFIIEGGHKLSGTITPQGAKNEALEVISAVLLTSEPVTISNIPEILDVKNLIDLLQKMGVKVTRLARGMYTFQADEVDTDYINTQEFVQKCAQLRGSVMVVGPLLSRFGHAWFAKPGGDKIGRRRVDTHLDGMVKLGASMQYDPSRRAFQLTREDRLVGRYMLLEEASVTGTANIVMAAVLAKGTTTIYNAACEPYLQQLCKMLNRMGAFIDGVGSNLLRIHGVEALHGTLHQKRLLVGSGHHSGCLPPPGHQAGATRRRHLCPGPGELRDRLLPGRLHHDPGRCPLARLDA